MMSFGTTRLPAFVAGLAMVFAAGPAWAQAPISVPAPGSLGLVAAGLAVLAYYRARNGG